MRRLVLILLVALALICTTSHAEKLKCSMPNEEYQCGSACQRSCANLGRPCPIVNIKCNDACYCKDGYARNSKGICIPIKSCPGRRRGDRYNRVPLFRD